jgi:hypothetical protein
MHYKGQENVLGRKPLSSPILHRVNQGVINILLFFTKMKLDPDTTQDVGTSSVGVWFQSEEVPKESNGRQNSKESFVEMNKHRKMEDGVRIQMV